MADNENKMLGRRLANAYLSSVTSIALVLLLVGAVALLLLNARSVSDCFKENLKISVMMKQDVDEDRAAKCVDELSKHEFAKGVELISRERGEQEMKDLLGEDFLDVFETSPIPVSLDLSLKADYVSADSIAVVSEVIRQLPDVDDIVWQRSLVDKLNANIQRVSLVMAVFIALLLFISYVLINNAVRLSLYAKRFTIHTMSMVGATRAFIRRPFMINSIFQGVCAALLANLLLCVLMFVVRNEFPQLFGLFSYRTLLTVFAIVLAAGVLICMSSTCVVVNRLVSLRKAELYY